MARYMRNEDGYLDPTAHNAINNVDEDRQRFLALLRQLKHDCEYAGFELKGRIFVKDKRTGKVWR